MAPPEFVAWLPISEAERAQHSPLVEKDAGAEVNQTLEISEMVAPAADCAKVRGFFDRVAGAQGAPLVLVRQ